MSTTLLLLVLSGAPGGQVRIDWAGISDPTVERCGLDNLFDALVQTVLAGGFAVVEKLEADDLALELVEREGALVITAGRLESAAIRSLTLPSACDSTLIVEIQRLVAEVLAEVPPLVPPPPPSRQEAAPEPPSPWAFGIALGLAIADRGFPSPVVGLGGEYRLATLGDAWDLELLAAIELSVWASNDLWILEPELGAGIGVERRLGESLALLAGLSASLIIHTFSVAGRAGGFADGRLALPLRLRLPEYHIGLWLEPFARLVGVEHRRAGQTAAAYASGNVGVTASFYGFW